jgi:hypothetical protein
VLLDLPLAATADAQLLVDDEARRAGRPLVDRKDHARILARRRLAATADGSRGGQFNRTWSRRNTVYGEAFF